MIIRTTALLLSALFIFTACETDRPVKTALENSPIGVLDQSDSILDPVDAMKLPHGSTGGNANGPINKNVPLKGGRSLPETIPGSNIARDLEIKLDKLPVDLTSKTVTITGESVKLRKGPGRKFKIATTTRKGDVFTLMQITKGPDNAEDWYLVQDRRGNRYFVSSLYSQITHDKELVKLQEKVSLKKMETIFDPTPPLPKELVDAKFITLNFENTDIYDVITTFCELLQINYVIEGAVSGKITLQTFKNIAVEDLYSVLEQIIAINNITVVKSGNFYRFLPIPDAVKKPVSIHFGEKSNLPDNDRLVIQIIPLKHISVESIKKIISPLLTKNATFIDVPETSNLMIVELASNVKRIIKVVQALDIDKLAQSNVQLYKVDHADAIILVDELNEIFSTIGYKEVLGESLNFLAIERLNAVLVVNSFENLTPTIEFWMDKLDHPVFIGVSKLSTFVYYVQNAEADTLASLLKSIFQEKKADTKTKKGSKSKTTKTTKGSKSTSTKTDDKDTKTKPQKDITKPRTNAATATAATKSTTVKVTGGIDEDVEGELTVIPDKDTNSLIIRTSPRNYPAILELLNKLDLMPQQVLIEVLILDLTITEDLRIGIEGIFETKIGDNNIQFGSTAAESLLGGSIGTATGTLASGMSLFAGSANQFVSQIQAVATDSDVNVVANPILVTSDNKPASISITDEVPIVTTTSTPSTSGSQITQQVEFRSVGVILNIEPKINNENFVNLKIDHEISELGVRDTTTQQPTFNTRTVSTEVVLKDNQSLVMGGLMRNRINITSEGIPLLKDIPYIGKLFGTEVQNNSKTELMLFLTPHVISNTDDATYVTNQFKNRIQNLKRITGK